MCVNTAAEEILDLKKKKKSSDNYMDIPVKQKTTWRTLIRRFNGKRVVAQSNY